MKICIAQTEPRKGNISANIEEHRRFIDLALSLSAEAIFFPELSLTGYEPELAGELAVSVNDSRLDTFQDISNHNNIVIGLGLPVATESKPTIGMVVFEPNQPRKIYSKQLLHSDETPYFEQGIGQLIIRTNDKKIAPAICYESLQPAHSENAYKLGADVYLASVAKPAHGIQEACACFPGVAAKYSMPVLMSNSVGFCDNFFSAGKSSVWTKEGKLAGQLDDRSEGILIFDTETEEVIVRIIKTPTG